MPSFFGRFKRKQGVRLDDDEKGAQYEKDDTRPPSSRLQNFGRRRSAASSSPRERAIGNYAPHPMLLRGTRFLLYGITSLSALATAALGIAVVQYYNTHGPVIKPAWGSLIACIVFGLGTPFVLYGPMLLTPFLFRPGTVLGIINQTRMELLMLFGFSVVWISGALALACDLRGRENCLWDGYYHYPRPSDFDNVCTLINVQVALAYTTFGLCVLQMCIVFAFAGYTLLYLDQEVLTEPTNDLGGRAYRARQAALTQRKTLRTRDAARRRASTSPSVSPSSAGPLPSSRRVPVPSVDAPARRGSQSSAGASAEAAEVEQGRYRDEEPDVEGAPVAPRVEEDEGIEGEGYYGFEHGSRRARV